MIGVVYVFGFVGCEPVVLDSEVGFVSDRGSVVVDVALVTSVLLMSGQVSVDAVPTRAVFVAGRLGLIGRRGLVDVV